MRRLTPVQVGSRRKPGVSLRFVLGRNRRVTFVLQGPEPRCATAARFSVVGHRGVNRIRLAPILRRHRVAPGVYRLAPRSPARGRAITLSVSKGGRLVALRRHVTLSHCGVRATEFRADETSRAKARSRRPAAPTALKASKQPPKASKQPLKASKQPAKRNPPQSLAAAKIPNRGHDSDVSGGKIASNALLFDQPPSSVLRFGWIVLSVLLAVSMPAVFIGAAWRDLRQH